MVSFRRMAWSREYSIPFFPPVPLSVLLRFQWYDAAVKFVILGWEEEEEGNFADNAKFGKSWQSGGGLPQSWSWWWWLCSSGPIPAPP